MGGVFARFGFIWAKMQEKLRRRIVVV